MKFITFSFDDGCEDDIRLVDTLNRYNLKATFNLNSGHMTKTNVWKYCGVKDVRNINYYDFTNLYDGHEIASHAYTHPYLEQLDRKTLDNQIKLDKKLLEFLYGCEVRGMAYPFGTYSDEVIRALQENAIEYGRTIVSSNNFKMPDNPFVWNPTCHYRDKEIKKLADAFLKSSEEEDMLFYIWGHSYELMAEEDWQVFEEFCEYISRQDDVKYCTNIEVLDYIKQRKY